MYVHLFEYCTSVNLKVHLLYLSESFFCSFARILLYNSEENVLFTPLKYLKSDFTDEITYKTCNQFIKYDAPIQIKQRSFIKYFKLGHFQPDATLKCCLHVNSDNTICYNMVLNSGCFS